jgi:hypothetical protein
MDFKNILYTPLDCPPVPEFDKEELMKWLDDNAAALHSNTILAEASGMFPGNRIKNYPWNFKMPYLGLSGYVAGFDKKFPQLVDYFINAFGLKQSEVIGILLLPIKSTHTGYGFAHQDFDFRALRMYLDFEYPEENKLYLHFTKEPHDKFTDWFFKAKDNNVSIDTYIQPGKVEARILKPTQCFYLDNVRAQHSVWTGRPGNNRLAVQVMTTFSTNTELAEKRIGDLVKRSAEKYADYAVHWSADQSQHPYYVAPEAGIEPTTN